MNRKAVLSGASMLFFLATLAACGGRGSDSSSTSAPPPDNSASAPPPATPAVPQRPNNVAGFVYGVNFSNSVLAYTIDASTGALSEMPGSPFPAGDGPQDLTIDPSGRFIYVRNVTSGDVSAYAIDSATGALSQVPGSPYTGFFQPEQFVIDPSGKFMYVASGGQPRSGVPAGEPAKIWGYSINATTGELSAIAGSPFASPVASRTFTFNHSGRIVYVVTDHNGSTPSIFTYAVNATTGALTQIGTNIPTVGSGPLVITPSGEFAYISNSDSIAMYRLDPTTGVPGKIDADVIVFNSGVILGPSGKFIYAASPQSQDSVPSITVFAIDPATGRLSQIAGSPFAFPPGWADPFTKYYPSFHPSGKFLYLANGGRTGVFAIDPETGAPSEIAGSPFVVSPFDNGGYMTIDPSGRVGYGTSCDTFPGVCEIISSTIDVTTGAPTTVGRLLLETLPAHLTITGTVP